MRKAKHAYRDLEQREVARRLQVLVQMDLALELAAARARCAARRRVDPPHRRLDLGRDLDDAARLVRPRASRARLRGHRGVVVVLHAPDEAHGEPFGRGEDVEALRVAALEREVARDDRAACVCQLFVRWVQAVSVGLGRCFALTYRVGEGELCGEIKSAEVGRKGA